MSRDTLQVGSEPNLGSPLPHSAGAVFQNKVSQHSGTARMAAWKSCLGAKNSIVLCLFLKLWGRVPPMVFNLPLIEAFRGVLEFQRKFCVDQVSGKSVFFRSIPTVSDPEPPTPGMGVASTSGPRGSLGWSGLGNEAFKNRTSFKTITKEPNKVKSPGSLFEASLSRKK